MENKQDQLSMNIRKAWPAEKLDQLGPLQKRLLARFVGQDAAKHKEKELSVEHLQGLLEQIQEYYPEDLIPLSKLLDQPVTYN